ncbi:MAG: hypothetical protein WDN44_10365 [Sphingomonas sp.]
MAEELADRDGVAAGDPGNELADGVVEAELAFVLKHQDRRGGELLRDRGDRIFGVGGGRPDPRALIAIGLGIDDPATLDDRDRGEGTPEEASASATILSTCAVWAGLSACAAAGVAQASRAAQAKTLRTSMETGLDRNGRIGPYSRRRRARNARRVHGDMNLGYALASRWLARARRARRRFP